MTGGMVYLVYSYGREDKTCTCNFGAWNSKNLHS